MRTSEQILSELQTIEMELLKGIPSGDIHKMLEQQSILTVFLASSSSLVSDSKSIWNSLKKSKYLTLISSSEANKQYFSASIAKDYIDASCFEECRLKDYADRLNSALVHTLDSYRTAISAEMKLFQAEQYSNTR